MLVRNKQILIILVLIFGLFSTKSIAQKIDFSQNHIVESNSIVGIWQMAGELRMGDKISYITMPTLKIYMENNTFSVIQIVKTTCVVTLYGNV